MSQWWPTESLRVTVNSFCTHTCQLPVVYGRGGMTHVQIHDVQTTVTSDDGWAVWPCPLTVHHFGNLLGALDGVQNLRLNTQWLCMIRDNGAFDSLNSLSTMSCKTCILNTANGVEAHVSPDTTAFITAGRAQVCPIYFPLGPAWWECCGLFLT